jgi:hypothetical protein
MRDKVLDCSWRGRGESLVHGDSRLCQALSQSHAQLLAGYSGPKAVLCGTRPNGTRSGLLAPIQGGRWNVSCFMRRTLALL